MDLDKNKMSNIYGYKIPLVKDWHFKNKLKPETGKTFQNFGLNWWDLLKANRLANKHKIKLKFVSGIYTIVAINLGKDMLKVKDTSTNSIYNIPSGERADIDNYKRNNYLIALNNPKCLIQQTVIIGNVILVLFNLQNMTKIQKTVIFKDFYLMSGIPNKYQYMDYNTNLNLFLSQYKITKSKLKINEEWKVSWTDFLENQWKNINPSNAKLLEEKNQISKKIHWVWISKTPGQENPLKKRFNKFMKTWILRNPHCEYCLWTDSKKIGISKELENFITVKDTKDIEKLFNKLPNDINKNIKYLYKNHPNVGARSDVLRQAILYVEGGCYADVNDMSCLMKLEGMFERLDFMIGLEPVIYVNNAFIAAKKKHIINYNFLKYVSLKSKDFINEWNYLINDPETTKEDKDNLIVSQTGPLAMTSIIFGLIDYEKDLQNTCIFPSSWIYPNYGITDKPKFWLKPISLTAHFDARDYLN